MLGSNNMHVDIAVKDLAAAKAFYQGKLGLELDHEDDHGCQYYKSGNGTFKVYQSSSAGTNKATYASWDVDDVAAMVEELKDKGISFEHYDMPGVTHEGDVHVMGNVKAAWFKDPDGNILCVGNEEQS